MAKLWNVLSRGLHDTVASLERLKDTYQYLTATRVENTNTTSEAQALGPEISNTSTIPLEAKDCPGIEERLRNLETHFGYKPGMRNQLIY